MRIFGGGYFEFFDSAAVCALSASALCFKPRMRADTMPPSFPRPFGIHGVIPWRPDLHSSNPLVFCEPLRAGLRNYDFGLHALIISHSRWAFHVARLHEDVVVKGRLHYKVSIVMPEVVNAWLWEPYSDPGRQSIWLRPSSEHATLPADDMLLFDIQNFMEEARDDEVDFATLTQERKECFSMCPRAPRPSRDPVDEKEEWAALGMEPFVEKRRFISMTDVIARLLKDPDVANERIVYATPPATTATSSCTTATSFCAPPSAPASTLATSSAACPPLRSSTGSCA